ncbi:acyltransferase (plasmid) [Pseudobutyrivibrio xylanivorans]|uniref:Acyltransferase n=1 Tax=Pseudobutyrivibrio xylanivorans TaxID=185007 RepID=A0A5P6VUI9_PSEXY|nr:acyltransferase [Pseudobutyrivibrio xylanivorans]
MVRNIHPDIFDGILFVAGYVYKQPDSFKTLMGKKIKGLFVPWFIFSNLNILLSQVITLKGDRDLKGELFQNFIQVREYGDGLWFVAALFVAFIPFYFVIKYITNKSKRIIISFILSLINGLYVLLFPKDIFSWNSPNLPWHLEYIFQAMFWMILGYSFKGGWEEYLDRKNKRVTRLGVLLIYLILAFAPLGRFSGVYVELSEYAISIVGLICIIMLSKTLKTNKYLSYVGANTLIFFAFHGKVYAVLEHILHSKFGEFYGLCLSNMLLSSIVAIIMTIVMSMLLIVPAYIINTWFPWMVGRGKRK